VVDHGGARTAWVYVHEEADRRLGRALAWAARRHVTGLRLVVEGDAGIAARRLTGFAVDGVVLRSVGRDLVPVEPAPLPPEEPLPSGTDAYEGLFRSLGLDVVAEHGVVLAEERGLEVARLVHGPGGEAWLEVGVGRFDREAAAVLHADRPDAEALAHVVDRVRPHRLPGAAPHAVNRLGRERWLRHQVLADPSLVGLTDLAAVPSALPRRNLRDPAPAPAVGNDAEGRRVLVVCTAGVDLEALPAAADLVAREAPDRVLLVLPPHDAIASVRAVAAMLRPSAEVVTVAPEWAA
jgi:hypothetical protein